MPSLNLLSFLHFNRSNVFKFLERYKELCENYYIFTELVITYLPYYYTKSIKQYIKSILE